MERYLLVKGVELGNGYFNMACDEFLLGALSIAQRYEARGLLRIYQWDGEWVSLGYAQSWEKFREDGMEEAPFVRRPTGGGVVFHGNDLTYSLVIFTSSCLFQMSRRELYVLLHRCIMEVLYGAGVPSALCSTDRIVKGYYRCFRNPVYGDLLLADGSKFAGAAMKQMRDRILVQGSIEIKKVGISFEEFSQSFCNSLSKICTIDFTDYFIREEDANEIRRLMESKYMLKSWNEARQL